MFMKFFSSYYFIYKIILWLAILYSITFLIGAMVQDDPLYILVRPPFDSQHSTSLLTLPGATVYAMGKLEIANPTIQQRLFYPDTFSHFDVVKNTFWLILSVILLKLVNIIEADGSFRNKAFKYLRILGIALIIYGFIAVIQNAFMTEQVKMLTNNNFFFSQTRSYPDRLEVWIGILILWFGRSYKKATQLQAEQDLTV